MSRLFGDHTLFSAFKRFTHLVGEAGLAGTASIIFSGLDDKYIKSFDRRYGVKTSGWILLSDTSVARSRLAHATQYSPVNGWALQRVLRELALPRNLHFVDLGCGLGRACILAAEYGFAQVTGVELAPELCVGARENLKRSRLSAGEQSAISIIEMDALEFCKDTDGDVFFMYRPFSLEFLRVVLSTLAERAAVRQRPITIIYSERMMLPGSFAAQISADKKFRKLCDAGSFGQAFYVYRCNEAGASDDGNRPSTVAVNTMA
jgi:SAM-dependent methyltransferase